MEEKRVDVLVLGGGASGAAAAWQAARAGASVLLVEPTPWLGGALSAAGAALFPTADPALTGGLARLLRAELEQRSGERDARPAEVAAFDPRLVAEILARRVAESGAEVWHGHELAAVQVEEGRVVGARVERGRAASVVRAHVTIDATELGQALALADVPFRIGRDARARTAEPGAPEQAQERELRPASQVALLRRFPGGAAPASRSAGSPGLDRAALERVLDARRAAGEGSAERPLPESLPGFHRLSGEAALLEWREPDGELAAELCDKPAPPARPLAELRQRALAYVRYAQERGAGEWGLDPDAYDTRDRLPWRPWVREGRRVLGLSLLTLAELSPRAGHARPALPPDSIAVGAGLGGELPSTPFQIGLSSLVPAHRNGLIVAELAIAATHIASAASAQPQVLIALGQAAGAAAALAAELGHEPREFFSHDLQQRLVDEGCALFPYTDVAPDHRAFRALQRYALGGEVDTREPLAFEPERPISRAEAQDIAERGVRPFRKSPAQMLSCWRAGMTRAEFLLAVAPA